MTEKQLDVARAHVDGFTKAQGWAKPNMSFVQGFIEDLASAGLQDATVDITISNCVINLSPAKHKAREKNGKEGRNERMNEGGREKEGKNEEKM